MIPLNQQDYDKYYKMFKGNFYKGASVLRSLLSNPGIADELVANDAAMVAIYTDFNRSKVDAMAMEVLQEFPQELDGLTTYCNTILEMSMQDWPAIIASPTAYTAVATHTASMTECGKVASAMNTLLAVSGFRTALFGHKDGMNGVTGQLVGMQRIIATSTAINMFYGSSYYVGKGIATHASLSHSTFDGLMTMSAVAASSTAMSAVAASSTARTAIEGSSTAINTLAASSAVKTITGRAMSGNTTLTQVLSGNIWLISCGQSGYNSTSTSYRLRISTQMSDGSTINVGNNAQDTYNTYVAVSKFFSTLSAGWYGSPGWSGNYFQAKYIQC